MNDVQQASLFGDDPAPPAVAPPVAPPQEAPSPPKRKARAGAGAQVQPAAPGAQLQALAGTLPSRLHLGTSSWHFPGWQGLVWEGAHAQPTLSRHGLKAYAQHPLLRSVSLDRGFYRPLTASQYAQYAAQVPPHFRFVVKAPSLVCDALVRGEDGRALQPNPAFLDPALAIESFVRPALEGLGSHVGALVFQISPLPLALLAEPEALLQRLAALLHALPALRPVAPDAVVAVEVRDAAWLTPAFAEVLRRAGATYCLGLHPKLPPIEQQLPVLRALWPGPLVCRWNLNRLHGAYGYEEARGLYEPFDRLVDPDPATRAVLARVVAGTTRAGHNAYVCINNKAEGSAPLSVQALAEEVLRLQQAP
ncbi:DUF72 domain-containing protein [Xenophilus arseniciresistens]|uniref:DUF72 domain-containing protein n=1 Tax=Xenophilus arseniciresistens TaxID=1283306 RepID=A0AAE3N4K9_9BURK|nr:DUF72 domain-containing protein [Xenophilus arseniciresistens]MDA7414783.1 DUF72 domain-containing protein [Xenophilus arseniciresistens]